MVFGRRTCGSGVPLPQMDIFVLSNNCVEVKSLIPTLPTFCAWAAVMTNGKHVAEQAERCDLVRAEHAGNAETAVSCGADA